ncbi:hypothetical protein [Pasteuria penetrans]|uniref:hypothetical protein n=1 Tax=Pasteuria penetrans TaxID=86005 RepID=UPI0011EFEC67|nr:hypothetical protein [Pasteuria penetrans]
MRTHREELFMSKPRCSLTHVGGRPTYDLGGVCGVTREEPNLRRHMELERLLRTDGHLATARRR